MFKCVAPGCTYTASVLLMGLSLCDQHKEHWCQVQLSYYNTLPKEDMLSYQEFMAKAAEVYQGAHPVETEDLIGSLDERVFIPFIP